MACWCVGVLQCCRKRDDARRQTSHHIPPSEAQLKPQTPHPRLLSYAADMASLCQRAKVIASVSHRCVISSSCFAAASHPPQRAPTTTASVSTHVQPDPTHVSTQHAPADYDIASAVVFSNFLTVEEGKAITVEVGKRMKRRRFEQGHWDAVIVGYREVELSTYEEDLYRYGAEKSDENDSTTSNDISDTMDDVPMYVKAIQRTREHLAARYFPNNGDNEQTVKWIPCHAIDLSEKGRLDAHVDSVKFSGKIVAGISLLSDSIMRLKPCSEEWKNDGKDKDEQTLQQGSNEGDSEAQEYVDLYLPKFSLYVLSGMSRFNYTHELLPSGSQFRTDDGSKCIDVTRGRRLSIIFRDELR